MRTNIVGLFLILAFAFSVSVNAGEYQAGYTLSTARVTVPFDVLIAYPTLTPEERTVEGAFVLSASEDSPVAADALFPIVVFAHGNGRRAGTPIPHHGLILELARNGYIVIAPFFPGGERPFKNRPQQVQEALDTALSDMRIASHANRSRMGMIGFSFGGAVALMNAGAKVNFAHLAQYCSTNKDSDPRACNGIPTDGSLADVPSQATKSLLSLKALVLLEPYGAPFAQDDLASVDISVMIINALQSDLKASHNVYALAAALPKTPRTLSIPGSHFVFIGPCPSMIAATNPEVCKDPPNVDRGAVLKQMRREIVGFLHASL